MNKQTRMKRKVIWNWVAVICLGVYLQTLNVDYLLLGFLMLMFTSTLFFKKEEEE